VNGSAVTLWTMKWFLSADDIRVNIEHGDFFDDSILLADPFLPNTSAPKPKKVPASPRIMCA
jgi:hypothetical protein